MEALDTNVLIRFLVRDDERQAEQVYRLFKQAEAEKKEFRVPMPVFLEMLWVLESAYEIPREDILDSLKGLLLMPILKFDSQSAIQDFLESARGTKTDLSDLLIGHIARNSGCEYVLTFDKKASRSGLFKLIR